MAELSSLQPDFWWITIKLFFFLLLWSVLFWGEAGGWTWSLQFPLLSFSLNSIPTRLLTPYHSTESNFITVTNDTQFPKFSGLFASWFYLIYQKDLTQLFSSWYTFFTWLSGLNTLLNFLPYHWSCSWALLLHPSLLSDF